MWPRRLPRPPSFALSGSRARKSTNSRRRSRSVATSSSATPAATPETASTEPASSPSRAPARSLPRRRRPPDEPDQPGEAVDVHGPGGQHPEHDPVARPLDPRQPEREGQQEQRHDRLLERLLGEVGGDQIGQRGRGGGERAPGEAQPLERAKREQRQQRGDGEGEPGEDIDLTGAEGLGEPGDEGVGAERVALVDQDRLGRVALGKPRGHQQVRGHVVVDEADAEDPDAPGGDERQGSHQHRQQRRPALRRRGTRRGQAGAAARQR